MTAGYVAHGVTLALAWFVLANALASLTVALAARRLVLDRRPRTAGWWLALRCLPAAAALAFVGVVFVPSYVRFEPREAIEGFDMTLTVCAAAALGVVSIAAVRGGRSWRRASHQAAVWMRGARPLSPAAAGVPAYTIGSAPMPLMALAGIVSPRVFVSERLVDGLSPDELAATLAHEAAHARSGDNFKRLVIRLLPDGLAGTRTAAAIEQRWASAAEHEADRTATAGNPAARCALASALVKVARLMPPAAAPLDPISTLVGGGDLASRVESLLDEPIVVRSSRAALWGAAAALACSAFAYAPLLRAVHEITEILVNSLP